MAASSPFIIEDDCFFFESDHLALKGNKDYCEVLKTIVILTAQREKLIKDYSHVIELKRNVLEDADNVLQKIINGEDLAIDLPPTIEIPKIPVINFEKYSVRVPEKELNDIYTANSQNKVEEENEEQKRERDNYKVWTAEEQKKLEELLVKYPPEPIESRRYRKIAKELGKTVSQVSSRIQKYFLKLYKAGLPIPGRIPRSLEKHKKAFLHKHQRNNHYLWKPSTFFPDFNTPVTMNEAENVPGPSIASNNSIQTRENYLLETGYQKNDVISDKSKADLQLQLLKKIREVKLREQERDAGFKHIGYKCDYCNVEPIEGTRWQCTICPESVDFCTDCLVSQMYTNDCHPLAHPMVICEDDENQTISHDTESSKNAQDNGGMLSDSSGSEYGDNNEKGDNEEYMETDEGSRGNFDSDVELIV